MGLGFAEVEARWVSGVFSRVIAVNAKVVMGGNSLGPGLTDGATNCANIDTIRLRWESLVKMENVGFDLTKSEICPIFIKDLTAKGVGLRIPHELEWETFAPEMRFSRRPLAEGVGLRVTDFHTGNHLEDDFTPLKTIQRSYSVIREKIPFELKGETFKPERRDVK
nr:hypothetical protein [Tanacetum cinerariifolium]